MRSPFHRSRLGIGAGIGTLLVVGACSGEGTSGTRSGAGGSAGTAGTSAATGAVGAGAGSKGADTGSGGDSGVGAPCSGSSCGGAIAASGGQPSTAGTTSTGGTSDAGDVGNAGGVAGAGDAGSGGGVAGAGGAGAGGAAGGVGGADPRSPKRGVAYNFCDWDSSEGRSDLDLLREGTTTGSGMTWYYNWGPSPTACVAEALDDEPPVEFVPMAWGLTNGGADCASGGACFVDALSRDAFISRIPSGSRYLLGFNEPNFAHQSALTPTVAAAAWENLEYVADALSLGLVGPAINYCDTTPGSDHGGSCTEEPSERTFSTSDYEETFPAAHRYNAFEWLELFYDECSASGAAGHDCRIDYQAGHVYSYWGLGWFIEAFERKAGIVAATAAHCENGTEDEDEFGVDCGGNDCAACTEWARAQFAKAVWLTEFAPSTDDAGGPQDAAERLARTLAYIDSELLLLEGDDAVFRYAWFMPKTDIGSLDHVDLLTESTPVARTEVGLRYLNFPH